MAIAQTCPAAGWFECGTVMQADQAAGQAHSNGGSPPQAPSKAKAWDAEGKLAQLQTHISGLEAKKAELEVCGLGQAFGGLPVLVPC